MRATKAHLKRAERYDRAGDNERRDAHIRRAIYYGKQAFGTAAEISALRNVPTLTGSFLGTRMDIGDHKGAYCDRLRLEVSGERIEYNVTLESHGGYNGVFSISPGNTDVLIRVAHPHAPDETEEARKKREMDFEKEVAMMLKLAGKSIVPRIYATLNIDGRSGFALERFDFSLDAVAKCPSLIRRLITDSDGEEELVDLFARSSRIVRCIDTKPANVVVRLTQRRAKLALIDVDGTFCSVASGKEAKRTRLDEMMKAIKDRSDTTSNHAATMSLLVFCFVAAMGANEFGFPFVKIATALLNNWESVSLLVRDELDKAKPFKMTEKQEDGFRWTVADLLNEYCLLFKCYKQVESAPDSQSDVVIDMSPPKRDVHSVLQTVHDVIQRSLETPQSLILRLAIQEDPDLYENAAMAVHSGIKVDLGTVKSVDDLRKKISTRVGGGCLLKKCTVHQKPKRPRTEDSDPNQPDEARRSCALS
jgi:hypothetical protein